MFLTCNIVLASFDASENKDNTYLYYYSEYRNNTGYKRNKILNLEFELNGLINVEDTCVITAKVRKVKYLENLPYKNLYYESGYNSTNYLRDIEILFYNFLEKNKIEIIISETQILIRNFEELNYKLEEEIKLKGSELESYRKKKLKSLLNKEVLVSYFSPIIENVPTSLKVPGDIALKNSILYQYKSGFRECFVIDKINNLQLSKETYYIDKKSKLNIYTKSSKLKSLIETRLVIWNEKNNILKSAQQNSYKPTTKLPSYNSEIAGTIKNPKDKYLEFEINELSALSKTYIHRCDLDSVGYFSLQLNLNDPALIAFKEFKNIPIWIEPGEKIEFIFNELDHENDFQVFGSGMNNIIFLEKEQKFLSQKNLSQNKDPDVSKFEKKTDSLFVEYVDFLKNFRADISPLLYNYKYSSALFKQINKKTENLYRYYFDDIQNSRKIDYTQNIPNNFQLPFFLPGYISFLSSKFYKSIEYLRSNGDMPYTDPRNANEMELFQASNIALTGKALYDYTSFIVHDAYKSRNYQLIDRIKKVVETNFYGTELAQVVRNLEIKRRHIEPGQSFPEIEFIDENGDKFNLRRYKGKVVYLHFWKNKIFPSDQLAIEETKLHEKYNDGKVVFINIGLTANYDNWKNYISANNLPGVNCWAKNSLQTEELLNLTKLKQYFLIDKNGKIINNDGPEPENAGKLIESAVAQKRNEKLIPGFIIGFLCTIVLGLLVMRINRVQQKRRRRIEILETQLREIELKAVKSQLNPHFLFNSLSSIQSLINQNRIEAANNYLSDFSKLLRNVLEFSNMELIPLQRELETLKLYCEIEKLRFNFTYMIKVDPKIDVFNTNIPPLLIQPFAENAIQHGLLPKEGDKELKIVFTEQRSILSCSIEDNGIGRIESKKNSEYKNGYGISLSTERIEILNSLLEGNFKLRIEDILNPDLQISGTRVIISYSTNLV